MIFFSVFQAKRNRKLFFSIFLLLTFLYFLLENLCKAIRIVQVPLFSLTDKVKLFFISLFDVGNLSTPGMLVLVILFIFTLSLFFLNLSILYRESKNLGRGKNLLGTLGILISVLGLSCASCGIGLLASVLSFFGASYLVTYFPLHGLEFGYFGILCLLISNYFLWKRIKSPYTCD